MRDRDCNELRIRFVRRSVLRFYDQTVDRCNKEGIINIISRHALEVLITMLCNATISKNGTRAPLRWTEKACRRSLLMMWRVSFITPQKQRIIINEKVSDTCEKSPTGICFNLQSIKVFSVLCSLLAKLERVPSLMFIWCSCCCR